MGQLTGVLHIKWQPVEEGVADQLVKEQSQGELNHTLEGGREGQETL